MADKDRPLPYYKWEWQAWRANRKVQRMSYIERGIYRELLDECWVEGGLPNSLSAMADIVGCPLDVMKEAWKILRESFTLVDGIWHNDKLDSVRTDADKVRAKRARAGAAGGTAKSLSSKKKKQPLANASKSHIEEKSRVNTPHTPPQGGATLPSAPTPAPEKPARTRKDRKALLPLPDGFEISERVRAWATKNGYSRIDEHFDHFILQAESKKYQYASWDAALMVAIRKDWAGLGGRGNGEAKPPREVDPLTTREGVEALAAEIGHKPYDDTVPFPTWRNAVLLAAGKIKAPAIGLEELAAQAGKRSRN